MVQYLAGPHTFVVNMEAQPTVQQRRYNVWKHIMTDMTESLKRWWFSWKAHGRDQYPNEIDLDSLSDILHSLLHYHLVNRASFISATPAPSALSSSTAIETASETRIASPET